MIKGCWLRNKLPVQQSHAALELLKMALALPLMSKNKIIEGAGLVLNMAKDKNQKLFCNEIMGIVATLSKQMSVFNLKDNHILNILFNAEQQYAYLKKCKTASDLLGNI